MLESCLSRHNILFDQRLLILIPVYNGAQTIVGVIDAIRSVMQNAAIPCQILAVNDGSTDDTEKIIREKQIAFRSHESNLGKGAALKTGFRYALENDYSLIATIDADGQHDPVFLPEMVRLITEHEYELVIGTRKKDPNKMSPARIFSNAVTSWLISIRAGCKIPDSQSGYRIIRTQSLQSIELKTNRYETESELLIRAGRKKWRIGFTPITTIYAGETSHISHVKDTWRFIKMYFKTLY